MIAALDTMLRSGTVSAIVLAGLAASVIAFVFTLMRHRRTAATATKLVDLALGGRADEARIQARNATSELVPLLDALSGELAPPRLRPPLRELSFSLGLAIPPLALCAYGISAISADVPGRAELAASFLAGLAILTPISAAAAIAILGLARQTARAVRASCVTLLARQVKSSVEAEMAEALRRGSTMRDPRGE